MEHGIYATFMPKPLEGHDGSGLHLHLSLFRGDDNAFFDADRADNLSQIARHFMAGLIRHGREITAITNQWVNSYKRLVSGFDAPVLSTWDRTNQAAVVRVPSTGADRPGATRIEYRAPDPSCNPYLALSVILAAGLEGIEKGYKLPDDAHAERLPTSLAEALDAMESSSLVKDALGTHVFDWFLRNKRREWQRYEHHVSRFELEQYLPVL
jgi:glutamine synthetase